MRHRSVRQKHDIGMRSGLPDRMRLTPAQDIRIWRDTFRDHAITPCSRITDVGAAADLIRQAGAKLRPQAPLASATYA